MRLMNERCWTLRMKYFSIWNSNSQQWGWGLVWFDTRLTLTTNQTFGDAQWSDKKTDYGLFNLSGHWSSVLAVEGPCGTTITYREFVLKVHVVCCLSLYGGLFCAAFQFPLLYSLFHQQYEDTRKIWFSISIILFAFIYIVVKSGKIEQKS